MYLGMMGAVVLSWKVAPVLSLVCFLLMSVVHWGLGDTEADLVSPSMLALEVTPVPFPPPPLSSDHALPCDSAHRVNPYPSLIPLVCRWIERGWQRAVGRARAHAVPRLPSHTLPPALTHSADCPRTLSRLPWHTLPPALTHAASDARYKRLGLLWCRCGCEGAFPSCCRAWRFSSKSKGLRPSPPLLILSPPLREAYMDAVRAEDGENSVIVPQGPSA
jgi:hypothetical protein